MSSRGKRPPSWPLAVRAVVGGVKLAYEYLGLTLVHSFLWFICHLPFLLVAWSIWTNLGASVSEQGRLAYFGREDGRPVLVLADQNGKEMTKLPVEGLRDPREAVLSPDGKKVAFVEAGRLGLFSVADGSWQVIWVEGRAADPAFSPDGKHLVFAAATAGKGFDLYLMDLAGMKVNRLTNTPVAEKEPSWAPDGKALVFVAPDEDGNDEVWVMRFVDGRPGPAVQLTRSLPPVTNRRPLFSPDGRKIVYASSRQGRTELYLMGADGRGELRLTENRLREQLLSFSSTGSKIFFLVQEPGNGLPAVYYIPAQGGMERRLGTSVPAFPWASAFFLLLLSGALLAAPANAAMVFVSQRGVEDEPRLRDFFLGFKRYYLRAALVYGSFLLLGGFLVTNLTLGLRMRSPMGVFSAILSFYFLLFLLILNPHLFPLVVLQSNTFRKVWKKAFLLTLDNLIASGLFLLLGLVLAGVSGFTGILLVLFYPAALGHAARLFFQTLLASYEEPEGAEEPKKS